LAGELDADPDVEAAEEACLEVLGVTIGLFALFTAFGLGFVY